MEVKLLRAGIEDAKELHAMQIRSFSELLEKYQDFDTSPANEDVEKVEARLKQEFTYFYFICVGTQKTGAIRIVDKKEIGKSKRISPIFILPEFQGQGIAQKAIRMCEEIHGTEDWELDTILQEPKNCHLYEKLGYRQTGKKRVINERLTLVFYEKNRSQIFETADIHDLSSLIKLRMDYLIEDYEEIPADKLKMIEHNLPDYFQKHLNNDLFAFVCREKAQIISCCFLYISEKPSNPSFIHGKTGTVLNVYTKPEYRKKGIARTLLKMLIAKSEELGLDFVELKATDSGYSLYKSIGFKDTISKYHNMKYVIDLDHKSDEAY